MPLFEREDFRRVAGETLRPGGLDLTRRALDLCLEHGLPPADALALDLGCGPGATARLLASRGVRVLALDASPAMLGAAAQAAGPGVLPLLGRAEALPLPPACLDAVFCECVLSATGNARAVLAEAARTLKPGGLLAVSDLYLRGPSGSTAGAAQAKSGDCLSGALPEAALRGALDAAGFAELLFEDHSRLLAELAGRLIFAGVSPCGLGSARATGQGARAPGENARPGYFLCLAARRCQGRAG
ncbi:MAG TPA: class I SAM-dependent methyltransferase [Humidesulfovibrio sp.]|uniref:DVU_1556 family methyltransferase n=1 Tax=Humidesulfovibrio sp. TaxID=2910988 RepID=UPI002BB7E887|nr:class I SAM-dependent methyltransferase [Humidesulfovibrio sp.]HWR03728.1 class I SAM-dependent methyltransferase [Humidesulfovibrio sp.]